MSKIKVGIIGGSGLQDPTFLENRQEKVVITPFGKPSDALVLGTIDCVDCVFLPRHGKNHNIAAPNVNYRANVWALADEGCTHLIATTACRSLQGYIHPGEFVLTDDFLDRTTTRQQTFYDGSVKEFQGICHVPMNEPLCPLTRAILASSIKSLDYEFHERGTVITFDGPRLSTWAESRLWREWRADIINMTTVPEVVLAKEVGLLYASLALVTEYDTWRDDYDALQTESSARTFKELIEKTSKVIINAVPKLGEVDWDNAIRQSKDIARRSVMV